VGGPILRDKFFFFADYEYWYSNLYAGLTETSAINTYPTAAMRPGDFSGLPTVYDPATTMQLSSGTYTRTPFRRGVCCSDRPIARLRSACRRA